MPAVYMFKCKTCGTKHASFSPEPSSLGLCTHCASGQIVRDYRAEGVTPATAGLKREREGKDNAWFRDNFLPTADDYKSPEDPDGSKGLKQWNDEHIPADGNKHPVRPEIPKQVF